MAYFLMFLMVLVALFLILLVLVQRGRGGGLAGALGGMGGQSAFGTKAGDLFTRVTMVAATIWIVLCMVTVKMMNASSEDALPGYQGKTTTEPKQPGNNIPGAGATPGAANNETGDDNAASATPGGTDTDKPAGDNPAADTPAAPKSNDTPAAPKSDE